ncbi:replication initiation factor domain-containing protein [Luteimonas sp. M1R5S18]|uniref:Replication initiation factor domain-containing protein n=1 Tax=Luteimonas rhizosphaericola TaxID=3042024 RepID=A0ABT6JGZ3_9GAMM|nr:replication initiation factor domain-containing protein [Luteimonas rhizosphaericola]MDH5829708.1 replication initiation factor domain-containing protein [Luteimonas rhizosphaericola]
MIDWMAASVDLLAVLDANGDTDDRSALLNDLNGTVGTNVAEVSGIVARHFFGDVFQVGDPGRGRFYAWRCKLENESGDMVGLIELGGPATVRNDGTITARIELTGVGCRLYETSSGSDHAERWSLLASLLGLCDARLTRIDIAADDFAGQYPIAWALDQYEAGSFDRRGQRPKARLIDDMGNKTGKTLYVGSRQSENQLRIYEKGREQGDPDSPWVRFEGEFHHSNRRELPLDMLTDPAPYLVGAYPVLDFVSGIGERLRVAAAEVAANCVRAVTHFRRQYGPMLNAMLHASGGDQSTLAKLVLGATRSTLPAWCPNADAAAQLLSVLLFAPSGVPEAGNGHSTAEPKEA